MLHGVSWHDGPEAGDATMVTFDPSPHKPHGLRVLWTEQFDSTAADNSNVRLQHTRISSTADFEMQKLNCYLTYLELGLAWFYKWLIFSGDSWEMVRPDSAINRVPRNLATC